MPLPGRADFIRRYHNRAPIYRRWADYSIRGPRSPQEAEALISTIYLEVCEP